MNQQRSTNNFKPVKMEELPVEHQPTQTVATVRQTTGKLDMRGALRERVAREVQGKMPASWEYLKPIDTFSYDGIHFTLHEILGFGNGIMWVRAERSDTGAPWFSGIPENTEFKRTFYRPI